MKACRGRNGLEMHFIRLGVSACLLDLPDDDDDNTLEEDYREVKRVSRERRKNFRAKRAQEEKSP